MRRKRKVDFAGEDLDIPGRGFDDAQERIGSEYFSLVSISTLGFGELYLVNNTSKMLSVFLSALGILYPAVVIAKLVSFATEKK